MSLVLDGTIGVNASGGLYAQTTYTGSYTDGTVVDYTTGLGRISVGASDGLAFYRGGIGNTESMRIDSSGNLFLGATAQAFGEKFQMYGNYAVLNNASYTGFIGQGTSLGTATASDFAIRSSNALAFLTGGATERARIDSSGNLLVGATSISIGNINGYVFNAGGALNIYRTSGASQPMIGFGNGGNFVGDIRTSTTLTSYNVTSDYRLKENIVPLTGALTKILALKPSLYNYKVDPTTQIEGFIAHELQAVVPHAVHGEKDAVDDNGNPIYQGVDASFLIPHLVAAIQELKAEVDALKAVN